MPSGSAGCRIDRRHAIGLLGIATTGSLAGCLGDDDGTADGSDSVTENGEGDDTSESFDVELMAVPDQIPTGEEVSVSYEITNTGDSVGTQDVIFDVDGDQQAVASSVEIPPGDSFVSAFTYTPDDSDVPGVTVGVSSTNDSAARDVTVIAATEFDLVASLSNELGTVGETVTVALETRHIDAELSVGAYGVAIEYDTEILEFQQFGEGGFGVPDEDNIEDGVINALETRQDELTPVEPMVELVFEVVDEGVAPLEFVSDRSEINSPPPQPGVPAESYTVLYVDGSVVTTTSER